MDHSDRVVKILEAGDDDEASDRQIAMEIGEILQKAYPSHPWVIGFQSRGLVLRHLAIASEVERVIGKSGFASLLPREGMTTPDQIKHTVTNFAGELLELFSLPRGPWDGTLPKVPDWRKGQTGNFS